MRIENQQQPSQPTQDIPSHSKDYVMAPENSVVCHLRKTSNTQKKLTLKLDLLENKKDDKSLTLKILLEDVKYRLKPSGDNDPRYFIEGNKVVNLFKDISSRVETRVGHGLHANNITIDNKKIAIATQYPLKEQIQSFLEMIVQQNTPLIVVLASEAEINNQSKEMHNYFHRSDDYGEMTTRSNKTEAYELADKTKVETYDLLIQSQKNDFSVNVHHVTNWPDHGTLSPEATRQLIDSIKNAQEGNEGVPVIHCRAGVGRTGVVLCALAMNNDVSVERAIVDARECRNGHMVQTNEQRDCLIEMAVAKGWPVLKEDEPESKTPPRTSGLLKTIQSAEGDDKSAAPSKTVYPAFPVPPLLRKKNNENGQAIIDARGVRNAGTFENIFGKTIMFKSKDDGEYKSAAMVVDLLPLQHSGELMKSIFDNRTPVMVILGEHTENLLIEGVHNFFTKEKDYGDGIKLETTEEGSKKLAEDLNISVYSMDLCVKDKGITIPVIHAYDLPRSFFQDDKLINLMAEEINFHSAKSVDHYKLKRSRAIGDPNKLLPVFVCSKESNEVQGLIDAVIKNNKR
ncbi:protein-tyrosine phosphatase family protein [Erwinia tasmaniensis]|uniref:protein-tyrosine-phosphatase n=1 Tax=Erwinia tasmaniensis (strain DSM 17950 / CFBP 7177 / CIP 109463 / NCPPB 4357 / Et1/99) TaxID=465817 RepID=B2VCG2_ERWT9|nr:protein-tyrosine phosphatase family protein [Erwinia tasmaniensis]CAO98483.1 Putative tyrosine-protein phosphatase YopH (Virulence protein) [Erwinia tasmaniensis Et1/99]